MAFVESLEHLLGGFELEHGGFITLGFFLQTRQSLLNRGNISQHKLGLDSFHVRLRINLLGHMLDVGVAEETYNFADSIGLANIGEEFIAQALALASACNQTCDIDEFHRGRHNLGRIVDLRQRVQTIVGHRNQTHIRLDCGKGIIGGKTALLRKRGKQRRLADVRQAHNTDGKRHLMYSLKQHKRRINVTLIIPNDATANKKPAPKTGCGHKQSPSEQGRNRNRSPKGPSEQEPAVRSSTRAEQPECAVRARQSCVSTAAPCERYMENNPSVCAT